MAGTVTTSLDSVSRVWATQEAGTATRVSRATMATLEMDIVNPVSATSTGAGAASVTPGLDSVSARRNMLAEPVDNAKVTVLILLFCASTVSTMTKIFSKEIFFLSIKLYQMVSEQSEQGADSVVATVLVVTGTCVTVTLDNVTADPGSRVWSVTSVCLSTMASHIKDVRSAGVIQLDLSVNNVTSTLDPAGEIQSTFI